jgi:hypothetical protein
MRTAGYAALQVRDGQLLQVLAPLVGDLVTATGNRMETPHALRRSRMLPRWRVWEKWI